MRLSGLPVKAAVEAEAEVVAWHPGIPQSTHGQVPIPLMDTSPVELTSVSM